jgi:hypothetical protein
MTVVVEDMVMMAVVEVDMVAAVAAADTVDCSTETAAADTAIQQHKPGKRAGPKSLAGLAAAQPPFWGPADARSPAAGLVVAAR